MIGDGKGLNSPGKFAVAATYDKFSQKWGLAVEKLIWVDIWASLLERLTVEEINSIADYCVVEFHRPPVPVEFLELASRLRAGRPLSEPIVSKLERMAYLILTSEEFAASEVTLSEISDACLIAASVAYSKAYAEAMPDIDPEYMQLEFSGRANMFLAEARNWRKDATAKKGYWRDVFNETP
ncbi:hypothetical protein [Comamonas thiooxydans]|uniref:hypothetical protein n=1 Tax=Comamonas thiooxydans TaxID=363952 RepID=UPI001CCE3BED|nr:hypothetical protein [Comamonas thiooxydans]UBQ43410.1 hypothetical protein LCH15_08040 [Comamonas thiooxydans]